MVVRFENNLFDISKVDEHGFPFVLVGDEAFPLTSYFMRPYPKCHHLNMTKKVFNYKQFVPDV